MQYTDLSTTQIKSGAAVVSNSYVVTGGNAVNQASEWIFNASNMGSGSMYYTTTPIDSSYYSTHGHCVVSRINGVYSYGNQMWQDD